MSYPNDTDCRNCGNTPCDCAWKLLAIEQEHERQKLARSVWPVLVAESDPVKLRAELVQVAAVAVAWVEKIDRDIARGAR